MSKRKHYKVKVEVIIDFELDNEGKKKDERIIKEKIKCNPPFSSIGGNNIDGYYNLKTRKKAKILSINSKGRR